MKPTLSTTVSALAFGTLGLLAAIGIAVFAPTPPTERPDFERSMFVILPFAGMAVGWFIAYLAAPFENRETKDQSSARSSSDQRSHI